MPFIAFTVKVLIMAMTQIITIVIYL